MQIINLDNFENFNLAPDAESWLKLNKLNKELIYGRGQKIQIEQMLSIAADLGVEVRFPSRHFSKSVSLPVAAYKIADDVLAVVRDNFYDVNVAVRSKRPLMLRLDDLYDVYDQAWYDERKRSAEDCCPGKYDFSTIDWFSEWSGGRLIQEKTVPDVYLYYLARRTFLEGIDDAFTGFKNFESLYNHDATLWAVSVPSLLPSNNHHLSAISILKSVKSAAEHSKVE